MPSKGIQVYAYIAVPGISVEFLVPGQKLVHAEPRTFWHGELAVDSHRIWSIWGKTGRFIFRVLRAGRVAPLTEQWVDVNAATGDVTRGTLVSIAETPSIIIHENDGSSSEVTGSSNGLIISFGFYQAAHGHSVLPDKHQCYVTVTPDNSAWMGRVAPPGSTQAEERPLARFVLPGAHDVGMNSRRTCDALLRHAGGALVHKLLASNPGRESQVIEDMADAVSGPAVERLAPDIIASLAITQKDALATMLALGARYFEFRPAYCHADARPVMAPDLPDRLYFQHGGVPGMEYDAFLAGVVAFLVAHPTEVVIVNVRWDGVPPACARPSDAELDAYLATALKAAGSVHPPLTAGTLLDIRATAGPPIGQLRRAGRRLIMLRQADALSTYSDADNATTDGARLVAGFERTLNPRAATRHALVDIQCQATATNLPEAVAYSVLAAGASNSCLMSTKAQCDAVTLPWCRANLVRACGRDTLVVVGNDFFDGATADVAVGISGLRLA